MHLLLLPKLWVILFFFSQHVFASSGSSETVSEGSDESSFIRFFDGKLTLVSRDDRQSLKHAIKNNLGVLLSKMKRVKNGYIPPPPHKVFTMRILGYLFVPFGREAMDLYVDQRYLGFAYNRAVVVDCDGIIVTGRLDNWFYALVDVNEIVRTDNINFLKSHYVNILSLARKLESRMKLDEI